MSNRVNKQLTLKRYNEFLRLNSIGNLLDKDIAKIVGVNHVTICRYRRMHGTKKTIIIKGFPSKLLLCKDEFNNDFPILTSKQLIKKYGVSAPTINNWRKSLGLKSKKNKNQWEKSDHPKGMLGKKHTKQCKSLISTNSKRMWGNKQYRDKMLSKERLKRMSDLASKRMVKRLSSGGNIYSRCKRGVRPEIGIMNFRSAWEANYARYLNYLKSNGSIYKWEFEPETFWFLNIKRGVRSYTPDFKIWETEIDTPYYVEVKGWMDKKSATKLKRMKKYYKDIIIKLVDQSEYIKLKKEFSALLSWE